MSLLKLFCNVDDFWKAFQPHWRRVALARGGGQRGRSPRLSPSEIMTILIHFHQSHYRTFKAYYTEYVLIHRWAEFPALVSYNRFVELTPSVLVPLSPCWSTCNSARAAAPAFPSWTPPPSRYAITNGFLATRSLPVSQRGARPRWVGFMASNST